jgi:MraZ protein
VEESGQNSTLTVKPPLGMYPARLDDKGRLKLPTVFQQYFNSFPESKLFITSLDGRTGQIYSTAAWRENEEFLRSYTEDPAAVQDLLFNAQDLGAEAEMDAQGRVTVNSELRRELDLQGQELHLFAYKSHVQILTEAIYQESRMRARPKGKENFDKLERAGLK